RPRAASARVGRAGAKTPPPPPARDRASGPAAPSAPPNPPPTAPIERAPPLLRLELGALLRLPLGHLELGLPTFLPGPRLALETRLRLLPRVLVLAPPARPTLLPFSQRPFVLTLPTPPTLLRLTPGQFLNQDLRTRILGFPVRPTFLRLPQRPGLRVPLPLRVL